MTNGNNISGLGVLISIFIVIIMGAILIEVIADNIATTTDTMNIGNESFTSVNNTFVALANTNCQSVSAVRNSSGQTEVLGTDYAVQLNPCAVNVTAQDGTYYTDYVYFPSTYVADGTSRSLLVLITIFFAIAILLMVIGPILVVLKNNGIM